MALKESITTEFELYKWLRGTSLSDSYTFPARETEGIVLSISAKLVTANTKLLPSTGKGARPNFLATRKKLPSTQPNTQISKP